MPSQVLITGATGQQGGAVLRSLLASKTLSLHALTRNPSSPSSQHLASLGTHIHAGNLSNPSTLLPALTGIDAAFLVTNLGKDEAQQGKDFIEAAKEAGVGFVVLASVDGAERKSGVPHFESKWEVEECLRASGLKWTILRPVAFYDSELVVLGFVFKRRRQSSTFSAERARLPQDIRIGQLLSDGPVRRSARRRQEAPDGRFGRHWCGLSHSPVSPRVSNTIFFFDPGYVGARALENPDKYAGRAIGLAGDELTMEQVRATYARVQGTSVWKAWLPAFVIDLLPFDMRMMCRVSWFSRFSESHVVQCLTMGCRFSVVQVAWIHGQYQGFEGGAPGLVVV
jgi:uncharacterized protein YbjT (DUF2867 family)